MLMGEQSDLVPTSRFCAQHSLRAAGETAPGPAAYRRAPAARRRLRSPSGLPCAERDATLAVSAHRAVAAAGSRRLET